MMPGDQLTVPRESGPTNWTAGHSTCRIVCVVGQMWGGTPGDTAVSVAAIRPRCTRFLGTKAAITVLCAV